MNNIKKFAIFGNGGLSKEISSAYFCMFGSSPTIFVDDIYYRKKNHVKKFSEFDPQLYEIVIAIGNPAQRNEIVKRFPADTEWATFVSDDAILGTNIKIGKGSIVCGGSIVTENIKIGEHCILDRHTDVGHDCTIGSYLTLAPGAKVSGACNIADRVYIGANAVIKEKLSICSDVTIGMLAGVTRDITKRGTYVGIPAKSVLNVR